MSTVSEKILAQASGRVDVKAGEIVKARVDTAMMPDVTSVLAIEAMKKMGVAHVWDPDRVVVILDHVAPPSSVNSARVHSVIRGFAKEQNLKHFYDVESGVCHQVLPEHGHVLPGTVVIGADSHTCTHGAFGAFATGIGSTDMGAAIGTGKLWFKVPETVRVNVEGRLAPRIMSKDVILKTAKELGADGATYCSLEFTGSTIRDMSAGSRMTLCNMAIELGGKTGIVEPDDTTFRFLEGRVKHGYTPVYSDADAVFRETLEIDGAALEPQVACPHAVDNVKPVTDVAGKAVNQVFIGSCTNGRLEDLQVAAEMMRGKRIHPDVRVIATPASYEVYDAANSQGIIKTLMDAGAVVCNPSCSVCFGGNHGILAPGEVSLSTSNRNFRGRQGSTESYVYLCSPATAAASALTGVITDPREAVN
ncbi:3-isopropylmalate dehydratase large subunit [Candidatus Bathyarchaeota archaeon]|nr:3-isopropylmalate dehydratase large subunit [Candidatus Bathyarchaeota archaeon]